MSGVLAHLLAQESQTNALLDGILVPGTFSFYADDGSVRVGKFNLDHRLDACFISIGFLEANDIEFEREVTHTQPRLIDTGLRFEAVGTVRLSILLAGSDVTWDCDFKIMEYAQLKVFDDKNPTTSAAGFFQIGLGGCFVDEYFKESQNRAARGSDVSESAEKQVWRVALPDLPLPLFRF